MDGVARIRFDRPPVNAFTVDMFRQLRAHLRRAGESLVPVLLTGANGRFSAGFDVNQRGLNDAATADEAHQCVAAIQDHPAPVVAAVEGAAVGIGLLIAVSADILVISRSARLGMPEVKLGIDSDAAPLRRFLPDPWIRRICLSGDTFTAADLRIDCFGADGMRTRRDRGDRRGRPRLVLRHRGGEPRAGEARAREHLST